jgi:hypothetical protein
MSEYATFNVMSSDVTAGGGGTATPFFPSPAATPAGVQSSVVPMPLAERVEAVGVDRARLLSASESQLEQIVVDLLGALRISPAVELLMGERHGDGSLRLPSQVSVWVLGIVTDAYGRKLVRLSQVRDPESLRSVGGLSRLLHAVIQRDQGGKGAA